jgi:multiple sugar transport system ATP-binding protein
VLPLSREHHAKLERYKSSNVTLGIRPEHIHSQKAPDAGAAVPLKVQIEVVEPVGNEVFVYFSTGTPDQYVARLATDIPPVVGKPFELLFDISKIHFFEWETEKTI